MSARADAFLAAVRALSDRLDGSYGLACFGSDVQDLVIEIFGCATCHGLVADGRGVSYAGTLYHRESCIPPDLKICTHCDLLEDSRRVGVNGICDACHAKLSKETYGNEGMETYR